MNDLAGRFLIATPEMDDSRFAKSVAYICDHSEEGTMALVINRPLPLQLSRIIEGMDIEVTNPDINDIQIVTGGPLQPEMGCVIHPRGKIWRSTFDLGDISVTTSKDALEDLAKDQEKMTAMVTLGYAGWTAGQLEHELTINCWVTAPADADVIFKVPIHQRWEAALDILGINPNNFSRGIGNA